MSVRLHEVKLTSIKNQQQTYGNLEICSIVPNLECLKLFWHLAQTPDSDSPHHRNVCLFSVYFNVWWMFVKSSNAALSVFSAAGSWQIHLDCHCLELNSFLPTVLVLVKGHFNHTGITRVTVHRLHCLDSSRGQSTLIF